MKSLLALRSEEPRSNKITPVLAGEGKSNSAKAFCRLRLRMLKIGSPEVTGGIDKLRFGISTSANSIKHSSICQSGWLSRYCWVKRLIFHD